MLLISCGASPPPAERGAVPPLAIGPAAPPKPPPAPRPDALPRPPDDLALLVRVSDPEQLAREIVSILPASAASAVGMLDPRQVTELLIGKRLASVVDLGQSIDIASVGATDTSFVVSMAVKQEAEATLGQGLVLEEDGGLVHVGRDGAHGEAGRMNACAFTAGTGRTMTRLVCASDDAALRSTAAYLARGVAAEPLAADARLTLPGRLLRDKKDGAARAIGDVASGRLGAELVERFLDEVDRIDASLSFAGPRVEVALDLRLGARESLLAKALVMRSQPAPPPRAFFRLPADSILALHATGALAEDLAPLRKTLAENLESTLLQDGYQADKAHGLRERLESLVLTGGPIVLGAGIAGGREGAEKALASLASATSPRDEERAAAQAQTALVPWLVLELDEPPDRWSQGLRDVVQRALDAERTRKPGSKASTPRDPDGDHVDLRVGALDAALKLPKDTLHVEVSITPRTKGQRPARKGHLFVVPKAATTWIGYSEDAAAIASRLRLAVDDATDVGTLGKSTDAAALRTRAALGAGLLSFGGLGHLLTRPTTRGELQVAARAASRAASLGISGAEVVAFTASADAAPGSVRASLNVAAQRQTAAGMLRLLGL